MDEYFVLLSAFINAFQPNMYLQIIIYRILVGYEVYKEGPRFTESYRSDTRLPQPCVVV